MAKEEKKPEKEGAEETAPAPAKRRKMPTFGLVGGVMIVEGLAIFGTMKLFSADADPTIGLEPVTTTNPWSEFREIEVASLRVPHANGTRHVLYNVKIVVTVHHEKEADFNLILGKRKFTIEDAISRTIQEASELELAEPGKESLKRKIRFVLGRIILDDAMIEAVLIPHMMALPTPL